MDVDKARGSPASQVAHPAAEANQPTHDHRLRTADRHPYDQALSLCPRPHLA